MLIFTIGEKRLISAAVNEFTNDAQKEEWKTWARTHRNVRLGPDDPPDDGQGQLPSSISDIIRRALEGLLWQKVDIYKSGGLTEDEIADISNDIADINSITNTLS